MSRRQDERRVIPIVPDEVMDACPPCFVPIWWAEWLFQALAHNTPGSAAARARVKAGMAPFPCDDCRPDFEARMTAAGKCTRAHLESLNPFSTTPESKQP